MLHQDETHLSVCYLSVNISQRTDMLEPGQCIRYSDSLLAGRSGNQIPVGARFSVPIQTGCEAYPASYTMGTGS
jgi:hypothetical protein